MKSPLNDALDRKWIEASATITKLERELAAERRAQELMAVRLLGQEAYDNSPCQAHPFELIEQAFAAERERVVKLKAKHDALLDLLEESLGHHEYCGWGDSWEREGAYASKLPERMQAAIDAAMKGK